VTICRQQCLELNPTRFFDDFVAAFEKYLADLRIARPSDALRQNFDHVFQDVFVLGN
jgi:hypothetical protein